MRGFSVGAYMVGTWYIAKKSVLFIRTYVFGWDITDLRNKNNIFLRYLHKRYDEFVVLIILASISAVFNIILGLFCGTVGEIISTVDLLLSILSTYFLVKEMESL